MSGKLNIDGGQVKEEHVATYTPVKDADAEFRSSKTNLGKSKEKISPDGAEEKLLQKEDEAKIATRVDMADAKYVVDDHRNGDAKIELDASKRQFSGLTKEELLKYADDPFWIRLRWFMFLLFWALWLAMLAGAVVIIIRAPKCFPPPPKTWYEIGPLADQSSDGPVDYSQLEAELPLLENLKVQGLFINPCPDTYDVLDSPSCIDQFKAFVEKAKKKSIKVMVDLTANFVSTSHAWFEASANKSAEFADYFVWAKGKDVDMDNGRATVPNNWLTATKGDAWTWNQGRQEYYLHQFAINQADLNFRNKAVVGKFDAVLDKWMSAGAAGVRLLKARHLLVNQSLSNEQIVATYQPELNELLQHWSQMVTKAGPDTLFTVKEDGVQAMEWFRFYNLSVLRPPTAPALVVGSDLVELAANYHSLSRQLQRTWPALQLKSSDPSSAVELARFAMLLPATPVFGPDVRVEEDNVTLPSESFSSLRDLRSDASLQHGERALATLPAHDAPAQFIVCARWKPGHTGYVGLFNAGETARANLTGLASLPDSLSVHHMSHQVHLDTQYTNNLLISAANVTVPARSTVILSYVPKTTAEE